MAKEGRPPVVTEIVLQKLEEAFANGATDLQASFYAGIGKSTLYNYQNENPEFVERKEALKSQLGLIAKNVLAKSIKGGDVKDAQWYLERKDKEFNLKHVLVGDPENPLQTTTRLAEDDRAILQRYLDTKGA